MEDDLPVDAVERVRAIRNRYYEATKHMTREEKWEYDRQRYEKAKAEFDKRTANLTPEDYDRFYEQFPFLRRK